MNTGLEKEKNQPAVDEKFNRDTDSQFSTDTDISPSPTSGTPEIQSDHTCEQDHIEPLEIWKFVPHVRMSRRNLDIYHEGETTPFLWIYVPERTQDQRPQVILRDNAGCSTGIVAMAEIRRSTTSRSFEFKIGDFRMWKTVEVHGFTDSWFGFDVGGRTFQWKRTHKKELGASRWKQRCMKLVEGGRGIMLPHTERKEGEILMAYIQTRSVLKGRVHEVADVKLYVDWMTDELKHAALIIALGVIQREREGRRQAFKQMGRSY